ncbi:PAS domain S-box protein [Halalkalicoccus subterraneus]|uniref:PAS domain S-box protein n=1 Tax=Halalkalicoccus subterraneus TaxID=2675002 RepID=UPI001FE7B4DB|nr:PAS domain-containing sensor histidine kinase [Halalkalicoccus subterraneus]
MRNAVERYWIEREAEHTRTQLESIVDEREQIIKRVTDAIVEVDSDWRFTLVNEQAQDLYEMSDEDLLGRDFWDVFEDAKDTRFETEYRRVMETKEPASFVEYVSRLDGWFDINVYPKRDGGIAFYFVEVTEQRERQQELEAERRFISEALDTLDDIFYVISPEGDLRWWNEPMVEVTGYSAAELTEMRAIELFPEDTQPHVVESLETTLETGADRGEAEVQTSDGAHIPYEFINRRLTDSEGEILGIVGTGRDLTTTKAREQELRETKQRLEIVLEGTETGIWEWKIGADEIEWDNTLERTFGLEPGSFEGDYNAFAKRTHPDDLPEVEEAMDRSIESKELYHTEFRMIHEDGEIVWAEVQGVVIDQENGPDRLLGLYHEITERKQREKQLEAFVSVVSHDLRNPLTVADGYLELAQEECESDELAHVAQAHDRMKKLIENLLTLAREGTEVSDTEPVDLAALLEHCWGNVATAEATLTIDIDDEIQADRSRFQQLVENLFRNAVEHGGEDVTVTVGAVEAGFYIEDTGPGIPEDIQDDMFNAGYSTTDDGIGFGLHIVKQVADAHDWTIHVIDGADGGARFEITGVEFATE